MRGSLAWGGVLYADMERRRSVHFGPLYRAYSGTPAHRPGSNPDRAADGRGQHRRRQQSLHQGRHRDGAVGYSGKVAGLPLYRLLGGPVRDRVRTKFSVSGLAPDRAAEIAAWAVEQGFDTMKVKVGLDPAEDVARVAAVRQAVGPDVRLGVDANGGWSVRTAIQTIQQLYQYRYLLCRAANAG